MKTLKLFLLMTTVLNSEVWAMHNQLDEGDNFNRSTQSLKLNNSQKIDPDDIESIITAANEGDKESQDVVVSWFYDDLFTDEIKYKATITQWENLYENALTDYKFANLVIGITEPQDFGDLPGFQSYMQETYMIGKTDSNEKNYLKGRMYEEGWGCEKSKIKASKYYKISKEFPISRYRYATLCSEENQIEGLYPPSILKNYTLAAKEGYIAAQHKLALMYKVAAKEGSDQAIQRIVGMYREGQAVDCSIEEWKLIAERAERGGAAVHYILGKMYENGVNGAQKSTEEATRWYKKAAEAGNDQAIQRIVEMYDKGQSVDCSVEEWKLIAERAERGGAAVHYILGKMYENGVNGAQKSTEEAARWYKKAVEEGNDQVMQRTAEEGGAAVHYILGKMYENGENGARNTEEAVKWYEMAAEEGHNDAQHNLGKIYLSRGEKDKAAEWFRKASGLGHTDAQNELGILYLNGSKQVPQDYTQAKALFEAASREGHLDATNRLAWMCYNGQGARKDETRAIDLWTQAGERRYRPALNQLFNIFRDKDEKIARIFFLAAHPELRDLVLQLKKK